MLMNRTTLLALAALALPVSVSAQQSPPATPQPTAPVPAAAAQAEMAQIQQRLGALQQQAMQDSTVQAAEKQLGADIQAAIVRLDPAAQAKMARAEALQADVEAARAAGDNAKLNELASEAQALQVYFAELNPRVMALPEMEEKRKAFMGVLLTRMNEIDPQAQVMVNRLQELRGAGSQ